MVLKKKTSKKKHIFKKTVFHAALFRNGLNKFQFEIVQVTTYEI
jgi:hypothetical protein